MTIGFLNLLRCFEVHSLISIEAKNREVWSRATRNPSANIVSALSCSPIPAGFWVSFILFETLYNSYTNPKIISKLAQPFFEHFQLSLSFSIEFWSCELLLIFQLFLLQVFGVFSLISILFLRVSEANGQSI